jgi:tRNA/rRNA methyltransferase
LLTELQRDRLKVVLVSPRNPLNIGAAARGMANFGFGHLCVVAPYARSWREARSAVGAPQLLETAQEAPTLAEALADCTLAVGTGTLDRRKPEQPVVGLPALAPELVAEMERGGRVALVFGSEKHGLTRDDLSYCHLLAEIPTCPQQPSMNLGQAVAVCLYDLAVRASDGVEAAPAPTHEEGQPASSATLELLGGVVEQAMIAAEYSPPGMRQANQHDLRLVLRRLALNERDAHRILGLFRRIVWRLKH